MKNIWSSLWAIVGILLTASCGDDSGLTKSEIDQLKKSHNLVEIDRWYPKHGTASQPKYRITAKDGTRFVGKPQTIGSELIKHTYLSLKLIYNEPNLHQYPLKMILDNSVSFLMVEMLPNECSDFRSLDNATRDELNPAMNEYLRKFEHLEIKDLNSGNIMYCPEEVPNKDQFYVIDAQRPGASAHTLKNTQILLQQISWTGEHIGRRSSELEEIRKSIWGF